MGGPRQCGLAICTFHLGFSLDWNELTGPIPSSLGSLTKLKSLYLSSNQLSGSLPLSLTQMTALEGFAFGDNAGLCSPKDAAFQKWLTAIPNNYLSARVAPLGPDCGAATSIVYDAEPGISSQSARGLATPAESVPTAPWPAGAMMKMARPRLLKVSSPQSERWKAIQKARREGMSLRATQRELGIHRATIKKYMDADGPPGRRSRPALTASTSDTVAA